MFLFLFVVFSVSLQASSYCTSYDGKGSLTRAIDESNGATLERVIDEEGRVLAESLPNGLLVQLDYDGDNLTRAILPDGSSIEYGSTLLRIGVDGALLYRIDPAMNTRYYSETVLEDGRICAHDIVGNYLLEEGEAVLDLDDGAFSYDVFGRLMVTQREARPEERHFYFGDDEAGVITDGKLSLRILVNGRPSAIEIDGRVYKPELNSFGDIVALVDPQSGLLVEAYRGAEQVYGPEGQLLLESVVGNPWRLSAQRALKKPSAALKSEDSLWHIGNDAISTVSDEPLHHS